MPRVVYEQRQLADEVRKGNVAAACELARKAQVRNVTELLALVCPRSQPTVALVDTCADAMALLRAS